MVKNRIHAILLKHGYQAPVRDVFGMRGREWLATVPLRPVYQQALHGYLQILDVVRRQIDTASEEIDRQARATPQGQLFCTLPGVGHYTAFLLLAEIGDVNRFPSSKEPGVLRGPRANCPRVRWARPHRAHLQTRLALAALDPDGGGPARRPEARTLSESLPTTRQAQGIQHRPVAVARELLTKAYWMLRHVH